MEGWVGGWWVEGKKHNFLSTKRSPRNLSLDGGTWGKNCLEEQRMIVFMS